MVTPTWFTTPADQVSTGLPRYTCVVKFSGVPPRGGPNQTTPPSRSTIIRPDCPTDADV